MQPWIDLAPVVEMQNFVNCYAVINIQNAYYTITDLVEDDILQPGQKIVDLKGEMST